MSKYANPGELRTPVYFVRAVNDTDAEGTLTKEQASVFADENGKALPVFCKWVNSHGTEVFEAMRLDLNEPATLTVRYSPKLLDKTLTVKKDLDAEEAYEVVSIDDVEERHRWLEIKVQRKVMAR